MTDRQKAEIRCPEFEKQWDFANASAERTPRWKVQNMTSLSGHAGDQSSNDFAVDTYTR